MKKKNILSNITHPFDKPKFILKESKKFMLRSNIVEKFGKRFLDQDSSYIASINDIKIIYSCVNEFAFRNKLPSDVSIQIVDRTDEMAKAVFMFSFIDKNFKPIIKYIREKDRDTPLFMASAICHEMIHYYDFLFGPLHELKGQAFTVVGGRQLVGEYDSHGDYFQKWMNVILSGGIPVQINHPDKVKVRYFMNGKEIVDEKENSDEKTNWSLKDRAKAFYDSIKTDDLFIVQVKDDAVYVVMQ